MRRRVMGAPLYVFPDGRAGAGLLLLRLAVAGSGLSIVSAARISPAWLLACCLLISVPVAAGVLTRALAALGAAALPVAFAQVSVPETIALHVVCSIALVLTGPGAYSIDSALFGRRQIVLPNMDDRR